MGYSRCLELLTGGLPMKLTWLGHACFLLEEQGYRIVIDPYEGGDRSADGPEQSRVSERALCADGGGLPAQRLPLGPHGQF